jgi:CHC2 zinc finger
MPIDFLAIRTRYPLLEYCRERCIILRRSGQTWSGKCPLHQERHGTSFVIFGDHWTCFGKCGRRGDVIDLEKGLAGGTVQEAIERLTGSTPLVSLPSSPPDPPRTKAAWPWPQLLRIGTSNELAQLAKDRRISVEACQLAQDRGLLRFLKHREGIAWVITDHLCQNGVARLLGARLWANDAKAKTLPDSRAKRPIGILEAINFPNAAVVEGGPDLLAAFHFMIKCGTQDITAVVCMTSANAEFLPGELQRLRGKSLLLVPHADRPGYEAGLRWLNQLQGVSTKIEIRDFRGLIKHDGTPAKDLNDLTSLAYDSWESLRQELDQLMVFGGNCHGHVHIAR